MKKISLLLMIVILSAISLHAQEVNISLNLQLLSPQAEFKQSMNSLGGGIHFNGLYRFKNSPFGLGIDFSYNIFGTDSRDEPFSSTIPDLKVRVENSYNLGQFLFLGRAQTPDGIIRPYLEGLVGFNYFFTETTIRDRRSNSSEAIASDTNFEDFAFTWGGGTGVMIRVYDHLGREQRTLPDGSQPMNTAGYITFGVRYLFGNEAEYLKEGSIIIDNGNVTYEVFRSKTDMMIYQLGFLVRF